METLSGISLALRVRSTEIRTLMVQFVEFREKGIKTIGLLVIVDIKGRMFKFNNLNHKRAAFS